MILIMSFGLWLVYLALTANLQVSNLILGAVIVVILTVLARPATPTLIWRHLPGALVAAVRYLWVVIVDVIGGGLTVARIVLDPKLPVRPGIIAIPTGLDSEIGVALNAHATTLAPGELVIEIDKEGVMYAHVLDATHPGDVVAGARRLQRELLSRILSAFGR
jgi:multicomponent Na+:H+ antiporter subunit E